MSNDELEKLEKAGRFRKKVDKNKEKVMEMLKMNGPEYLPIQAGKGGLVIDEPSLKRRKLEIDDLAEKAQIIKQAQQVQYDLSMGRALLERKQSEFFEKQATPFQKTIKDSNNPDYMKPIGQVIRDTAEENKRQLDAINANLERNGLSDDKILALQGSIASIVDAVDISDDLNDIKNLIANVCERIEKIPAFKNDGPAIKESLGKAFAADVGDVGEDFFKDDFAAPAAAVEPLTSRPSRPITEADVGTPEPPRGVIPTMELPPETPVPPPETPVPAARAKGPSPRPPAGKPDRVRGKLPEAESKASRAEFGDKVFESEFNNYLLHTVDGKWSSKITLRSGKGFPQKGLDTFLNNFAAKNGLAPLTEEQLDSYADIAIQKLETTGDSGFAKRKKLMQKPPQGGNGLNEALQQYNSSAKTIDDVARLRNNLRKGITGKGLLQDVEMFGKKLKKNFTGKGGITTEIHKDFLKKNYKVGKGLSKKGAKPINYSKMNPEQLMKNLTLNIASMKAGNNGVKDQINSIIDQMLEKKIIKKAEHKRLWYELVDA